MKILFLTNNEISYSLYIKIKKKEDVVLYEDKLSVNIIKQYNPDFLLSYSYKYIIKKDVIDQMPKNIINLHISLLPWNRGADPNLWSFLDNTPKGITIHLIEKGIDTGEILLQKEIKFNEDRESLSSSYKKLHFEIQNLFKQNWEKIKNLNIKPIAQRGTGTTHKQADTREIKKLMHPEGWDIKITIMKKRLSNGNWNWE